MMISMERERHSISCSAQPIIQDHNLPLRLRAELLPPSLLWSLLGKESFSLISPLFTYLPTGFVAANLGICLVSTMPQV
jgi:hypothetical protein